MRPYPKRSTSGTTDYTFSATDLSYASALATAIDEFSSTAIAAGSSYASTFKSLAAGMSNFTAYTHDLYKYMSLIYNSSAMTTAIKTKAQAVMTVISNMTLLNKYGSAWSGKAYGCAITCKSDTTTYSLLDLCTATQWDEFCTYAGFPSSY